MFHRHCYNNGDELSLKYFISFRRCYHLLKTKVSCMIVNVHQHGTLETIKIDSSGGTAQKWQLGLCNAMPAYWIPCAATINVNLDAFNFWRHHYLPLKNTTHENKLGRKKMIIVFTTTIPAALLSYPHPLFTYKLSKPQIMLFAYKAVCVSYRCISMECS